jgi:ADP-ribose pyrophosphatase
MADERLRPWTIVQSTYRIDEPFLRLRVDTVALPNGRTVEGYFVRETRGFTIVAALTPEREIVLVRQYKHGVGQILLELPAGMIDPGESPLACGVRELLEETGYAGATPQLTRTFFSDPTNSNGCYHLVLIADARKVAAQSLDLTEDIVVETASLEEFARMLRDGRISTGWQVAAGFIALEAAGHA